MGWDPCDDRWWPEIAAALPLPWPREAVMMDLRWWASRVRRGVGARPGRPALCRRYGWPEKRLRLLIAEGEWEDTTKLADGPGPARGQPRASQGPARGQESAEDSASNLAVGPAEGQPGASQGPARGPTRVGDHSTQTQAQTQEAAAPVDLRNPGPPGDLPGKAAGRFYAAIWLDALRSVGLLSHDVRLSTREQADAERIARDVGGDRERIERTASWVLRSGAFEAKRAREQVGKGSLRWLLGDWPELDRLAHANGHRVTPPKRRETPDEMEARLAREAGDA